MLCIALSKKRSRVRLIARPRFGTQRYDRLKQYAAELSFFQQLPNGLLDTFLQRMFIEKRSSESIVHREGDTTCSFSVILSGSIGVFVRRETDVVAEGAGGAELHLVSTLTAGDSFSMLSVLEGLPRSATIVCIDDVELGTKCRRSCLLRRLTRRCVLQRRCTGRTTSS